MPSVFLQTPAQLVDSARFALIYGGTLTLFLVIRHLFLRSLHRLSSEPDSPPRAVREALRFPSVLFSASVALLITLGFVDMPGYVGQRAADWGVVILVLSLSIGASSLIVRLGIIYTRRRGMGTGLSGMTRALVHLMVLLLGGSVLLRYFDVSIYPILTAIGFVGLAIAFGLRDSVANFFAGVHILIEEPISVGDFIALSSGEEGTVCDIGWRSTRILTTANNLILLPNERITSGILTNYALPERRLVVDVAILAGLDAPIEETMRLIREEALEAEGVLTEFPVNVLFDPGVTPTHLQFKLTVHAAERLQQGRVRSALRVRIYERFRREGIPLARAEALPVAQS